MPTNIQQINQPNINEKVNILGIPFHNTTQQQLIAQLHTHIKNSKKTFVVTANPEIVIQANENPAYKNTITQADYITADGIGIVKAAQLLKTPLPERVTGFDIFTDLLKIADKNNYKIYLLGAAPETLRKTVETIKTTYSNANIVGSHHGYFDWSDETIASEIATTQPDLVFVALGMPRQEQWITENYAQFSKGIFIGVGGSFDVIAGTVKRAPVAWQKANLEWLYRIIKQPSRLKRSLAIPKFVFKILRQKRKGTQQ